MKMKLTASNVDKLLNEEGRTPRFSVEEKPEGIRIKLEQSLEYDDRPLSPIPLILLAAMQFQLDPRQFKDDSKYRDERAMGSSWTGEYGSQHIYYDVTFLFEVPE